MKWQPIKTAPPTHLLFYGRTRHDEDAMWSGWKAVNGRFYTDAGELAHPTHWMPLPEPPADKARAALKESK